MCVAMYLQIKCQWVYQAKNELMVSMEQKTHNTIIHEHVGALLHTQIDNCTITHVAACMAGLSVIATSGRATGQVSHVST